jgi:hypothetical protein
VGVSRDADRRSSIPRSYARAASTAAWRSPCRTSRNGPRSS